MLSQFAAAAVQEGLDKERVVEWPAPAPDAGFILTVSGPEGFYSRQEYLAGSWARFSLSNELGQPRSDGVYKWELVVQAGWEPRGQASQSGWFQLQGGRPVTAGTGEKQPVIVEENAPGNSLYVDSQGRVGVGTTVPAAQLHVRGRDPALEIEDTQEGGHEYLFRSLKSGDGSLGLFDETMGKVRWLVDSEGRIGVNTAAPTSTLTVDGYIESTKGFLVNGRPVGAIGLVGSAQPLSIEGSSNNFFGTGAGASNTTGYQNSFFGASAGTSTSTGAGNSFFGWWAGLQNTAGYYNCFFGNSAGRDNATGSYNSFFGNGAGSRNTDGIQGSFFGISAGMFNTTGLANSFFGANAGIHNTIEDHNTLVGADADIVAWAGPGGPSPVTNATAIGQRSYVSRSNSLVLGGVNGINGATAETFVGIGTPSPDRQLVVEGSQAIGKFRRFSENGPDFAPAFLFERARGTNTSAVDMLPGDYLGKVQFRGRVSGNMIEYGALAFIASDTSQNGRFSFVDRDLLTERMVVLNSGNVGIGTNAPTERLDVAGNLRVRGGIVYGAPAVPVPDYVFAPAYQLMPLSELELYVTSQKHLPNIPSANEIQANGLNLGEFQLKLLEKIEELTLYTVAQAKIINEQKEETSALREKAASQEDRIKALEETVKRLLERDEGERN